MVIPPLPISGVDVLSGTALIGFPALLIAWISDTRRKNPTSIGSPTQKVKEVWTLIDQLSREEQHRLYVALGSKEHQGTVHPTECSENDSD